jgi:monoamine oxidase
MGHSLFTVGLRVKATMSTKTDVIIVGAGAAGLTAGYTLHQAGRSIQILEANSETIGGRIRKNDSTFGVPIDLGAEWIHTHPSNLSKLVSHQMPLQTKPDIPKLTVWDGAKFYTEKYTEKEHRWADYTWWNFFNDHVAASIRNHILLGCIVKQIVLGGNTVKVICSDGRSFEASHVIVTVSIKVLQDNLIEFVPPLPNDHQQALQKFRMEQAVKVFIEFREKFYPNFLEMESDYNRYSSKEKSDKYYERLFFDEAFSKSTSQHILGLYAYGRAADQYLNVPDDSIIQSILQELDQVFGGKATKLYMRHLVQNWAAEPFIRTGFTRWVMNDPEPIEVLMRPVAKKIYFAGEALPVDLENWGFAHGAALSGQLAARKILGQA